MRVYNTLSGKKEQLKPRKGRKIDLFVCGITPYDFSHIGHARTYIVFDMVAKYLRQAGYGVSYVQNVTDVDDKIISRAAEQNEDPMKLSRRFEKEYKADMKVLGIDSVTTYARATEHIKEIISQVERLLKKGYAYQIQGDGIYFDISKFKEYGKLSGRSTLQAEDSVSRIDESVSKRNKGDFALWKVTAGVGSDPPPAGEPRWKSPWGHGRPGWHIEDTAITEKLFGPQYDIHGGARDLLFPHHEAEVTQMEAVSGKKPFVKYWMHTGFLTVQGEKMSKSLGNFVTIRDFLADHSPRLLRYFVLKTHYRSPVDYSPEMLNQAESTLSRLDEFTDKLKETAKGSGNKASASLLTKYRTRFERAMNDDYNTPVLIGTLFELIGSANTKMGQEKIGPKQAKEVLKFLEDIDSYLGFIFWGREKQKSVPAAVKKLAEEREEARKRKNWKEADALRHRIELEGWSVEDTSTGPKLKKQK